MATKTAPTTGRNVYAPVDGFIAEIDGSPVNFTPNTLVREGHWLLDKFPHLFRPVHVQYDVEAATQAPGELR